MTSTRGPRSYYKKGHSRPLRPVVTMLRHHRDAIRRNFVLLARELPCQEVLNQLHQDGILSASMVEEILEQPASVRNSSLILLIERRGPNAFSVFIDALKKAKRPDLADRLMLLDIVS